jgi:hypothetical protein
MVFYRLVRTNQELWSGNDAGGAVSGCELTKTERPLCIQRWAGEEMLLVRCWYGRYLEDEILYMEELSIVKSHVSFQQEDGQC